MTTTFLKSSLASRTRIKTLTHDMRAFSTVSAVPRMAFTIGVGTILDSREVVIVVTGLRKSLALSKAVGTGASLACKPYLTRRLF